MYMEMSYILKLFSYESQFNFYMLYIVHKIFLKEL